MKLLSFLLVALFSASYLNAQIANAKAGSEVCFTCHKEQAKDWRTTWHSRSHADSNPLYKAVTDYIARVTYQPNESVLVECAQCHNPKMTIKDIADKGSYSVAKALNLDTTQTAAVETAVSDKAIKDGISCNICHNVARVHESKNPDLGGYKAVEWGAADTIYGPFAESGRAGLHKSVQADHFINQNKLCMVCHYGGEENGINIYTTGEEYEKSASSQKCVDCHMPESTKAIIAPDIKKTGVTPQIRQLRSHLFEGARNSDIMKDTLSLKAVPNGQNLIVELTNLTPHKAPTGFGGRSMSVKVLFKNISGTAIDTKTYLIETVYADKKGKDTVPYLAASIKSDNRLEPNEIRKLTIPKPAEATHASVTVTYRLASERLLNILDFSDSTFDKEYPVAFFETKL